MKVVIDTNVLLQAISSRSRHYWLWEALREEKLTICITTDILLEYEEILASKRNREIASLVVEVISSLPNMVRVSVYYNFGLPKCDPDDQKFVDCAVACGASYLITEDKDFKEIKQTSFPAIAIISPDEFKEIFSFQ